MHILLNVGIAHGCTARWDVMETALLEWCQSRDGDWRVGNLDPGEYKQDVLEHVESVEIVRIWKDAESGDSMGSEQTDDYHFILHIYQFHDEDSWEEGSGDEQGIFTSKQTTLPAKSLHGLWERWGGGWSFMSSLVYDEPIPEKLLSSVYASMLFSDCQVDPNVISWNKLILLHGPPGTGKARHFIFILGKTSLCKALAQKLAIRLSHRYSHGKLIEINSHSLFSKYFSESGKLVQKMFQSIHDMTEDEEVFVCVLMDEVESLTSARQAAGNVEPGDAIRVVNALLTQLDHLKRKRNVLILTTSNITESIDAAFMDRADWKVFIGNPTIKTIYSLLLGSLNELVRVGLVDDPPNPLSLWQNLENKDPTSLLLYDIAKSCEGLSCRTIRKLPFLAYSTASSDALERYMCEQDDQADAIRKKIKCFIGIQAYLEALKVTVEKEQCIAT